MSLEKALQDQTAALREFTLAILAATQAMSSTGITNTQASNQFWSGAESDQEADITDEEEDEEILEQVMASKPEKKSASTPATTAKTSGKTNSSAAKSKLPAGERNDKYFDLHLRPVLTRLAALNRETAINLVKSFSTPEKPVALSKEVPTDRWEELLVKAEAKIKELEETSV